MSLRRRLLPLLLLVLPLLPAPSAARAQQDASRSILHQGVERRYLLHTPAATAPPGPRPLVVALHGLTQPVESLRAWLRLDPVADREGFVVAYPEAVEGRWGYWPGSGVALPGGGGEVDDVGFVAALLDALVAEGVADPARVYATGNSREALMAWMLACRLPDRLAAVAPLSSGMREAHLGACAPGDRPVPVVAVAGTADPIQPYDGWLNPPPLGRLLSIPESMEFWRRRHGCTGRAARPLPHRDPSDPTRTQLVEWTGCAAGGGPVLLYRVAGGGHQPPSFAPNTEEQRARFGRRGQDMETAEEIWRVFRASRPVEAR